jgi:hypothetical protein
MLPLIKIIELPVASTYKSVAGFVERKPYYLSLQVLLAEKPMASRYLASWNVTDKPVHRESEVDTSHRNVYLVSDQTVSFHDEYNIISYQIKFSLIEHHLSSNYKFSLIYR